jgi:hypothetical protein
MGKVGKDFLALMRKNWIIYKRNPGSAICELITPVLFMSLIVWVRTKLTPEDYGTDGLIKLSHPIYTINNTGGEFSPL